MASLTGWKPGATLTSRRARARSSWTVSRKESRWAAIAASASRPSAGLTRASAGRRSSRKSQAIGSQFIIGEHERWSAPAQPQEVRDGSGGIALGGSACCSFETRSNLRSRCLKKGTGPPLRALLFHVRPIKRKKPLDFRHH
jgi:hypothetical protein